MNREKALTINLIASITAFIVNIGISFFLTPYIITSLGVEAYGFVQLGTNFINYASLVTIALNSMAGRFITIEIHKNNWKAANKYFSSLIIGNCIVVGAMLIPAILGIIFLEKIISVPNAILLDVRILFSFLFANFLISILVSSFSISTFATNKLYLSSLRGIESNIIRAGLLIVLFWFFNPAVFYIGFAAFIVMLYIFFFNYNYMRKLLPKIKIKKKYFDFKAILELISAGIWNTVIHLGNILLQGLNLLISNIFIGATAMGMLAVANTVPMVLATLIGTISAVFTPDFTILYAKKNIKELISSIKKSMKILGLVSNIPIAILVVFGEEFFKLWVPNQDSETLQMLSILAISIFVISGPINSLYNVFTVTNRLKVNALILVVTGLINVLAVIILLESTNLGIFAIAGVSTVLGIIRNLLFTVPFGAKYLELRWSTFFPEIFKSLLAFILIISVGIFCNVYFLNITSWLGIFSVSAVLALVGFIINFMVVFKNSERKAIMLLLKSKLNLLVKRKND